MGAKLGNNNAAGNSGGKSLQDRQLAAEVRSLTLVEIKRLLEIPAVERSDRESKLYDALLVRLAGTVLPRLNEHSGEGGGAIPISSELTEKDRNLVIAVLTKQGLIDPKK